MKLVRVGFCLAVFFAFSVRSASALSVPKQSEGYVSDYAGMLSGPARAELEEKLRRFEEETSNQVVVAAFPSLEGDSLEDFSIRLAEAWKIGRKGKDNGVILLLFKNDRKVRIEVGYGLEGALPDATCKLIIENEIVPRFRQGDFDGGVEAAVGAIIAATKGEYRTESVRDWSDADAMALFFFLIVFGLVLGLLVWRSLSQDYESLSRGGSRRSSGGTGWSRGGSGGDGGGFSGGGGSFGGGGASGGW